MSAWGYPPEPEWEGQMEFTCSAEVHRRMMTPKMERTLRSLRERPEDPWAEARTPVSKLEGDLRWFVSGVESLLREWNQTVPMDRTCGWEGETDAYIQQGRVFWECPACGEEHDDPHEPDLPEPYDTLREAWGEA